MSSRLPTVTIIVPTRPGDDPPVALDAVRKLDYPASDMDVIVARGRQPSVQRNTALRAARGELVYFLDDDSRPAPGALRRAVQHFADGHVKIVGGPAVCPPDAPWIEQLFAVVLGSWLAFGPSRARYARVGRLRESSEKELILCNLVARRAALLELGGFDESLYPNEENALMDDLQRRGGKLLYDPEIVAERRPRPDLQAFVRMLLNYGRGRAEQVRLHPTTGSVVNFVPALFCVYLVVPLVLTALGLKREAALSALPLALYAACVLGQVLVSCREHGLVRALAAAPLIVLTHVVYGLGLWRGLFTPIRGKAARQQVEVVLEQVRL